MRTGLRASGRGGGHGLRAHLGERLLGGGATIVVSRRRCTGRSLKISVHGREARDARLVDLAGLLGEHHDRLLCVPDPRLGGLDLHLRRLFYGTGGCKHLCRHVHILQRGGHVGDRGGGGGILRARFGGCGSRLLGAFPALGSLGSWSGLSPGKSRGSITILCHLEGRGRGALGRGGGGGGGALGVGVRRGLHHSALDSIFGRSFGRSFGGGRFGRCGVGL